MTCAEAHQTILEADPSVLEGQGDSSLAVHIQVGRVVRLRLFEVALPAVGHTTVVQGPGSLSRRGISHLDDGRAVRLRLLQEPSWP